MCRILIIKSNTEFEIAPYLEKFAKLCQNSKEYQGHGWGCAFFSGGWKFYKNINPIWEDDFEKFEKTNLLIVHARSAFEDKDIVIENNMPFTDNELVFVFNGELRGVRIREHGRIGAEKIFNLIKRFRDSELQQSSGSDSLLNAIKKGIDYLVCRTNTVKAINLVIVNMQTKNIFLSTNFNERSEYFTMHLSETDKLVICSEKFNNESKPIPNNTTRCFK